ncbi:MAG: bifunctional sulfate adenylyltransferase/adenylylsulfate kinase [Gammaproteobacteria bacterium]|jgi:sulfate adenylyltransferase|nr:bifunctional sulfate adenylyltransferase/adenylylsulfate kinase [Gammaproteobacteria bacterium]HIG35036.1 bifunctional sulfate adenylyltransferase/adenylylsulfate kinase [Gammaproteobacteria bacterium]HIK96732.1 bifunctional sulfate adenylyltransferase/adenylylsulfate kinase [Gammaproteobacteria bacterium]
MIEPHGKTLVSFHLSADELSEYSELSNKTASLTLSLKQQCDLEMIANGAFSPLSTFNNQKDYEEILLNNRLSNGLVWPIPIVLDVPDQFLKSLDKNEYISLRNAEGFLLAILKVNEFWAPDKKEEANSVFKSNDPNHPGVDYLFNHTNNNYISGELVPIQSNKYFDFTHLRKSPQEVRDFFRLNNWKDVIAFQTRNPMHRAHFELTKLAMDEHNSKLLIHPVIGISKPGDIDHFTRVKCYQHIIKYYPENSVELSLINLAMRMAGPKEAVWHAIIRKNYGCNRIIIGRDHAGPGVNAEGKPYYQPYDAQELIAQYQEELEIKMVPFKEMVFAKNKKTFLPLDKIEQDDPIEKLSGTQFKEFLQQRTEIPNWYSFPEVIHELRKRFPKLHNQGLTVFFTGLSGAGKSTLANAIMYKLMETEDRPITLLDGDIVRQHLSSELGFSKEDRDIHVKRIGYVASEITKHGGVAICAPIAPYSNTRKVVRNMIDEVGSFVEIHVATPLSVCEERDVKGLYKQARAGKILDFTGVSDPYEEPENPEITVDTSDITVEESSALILDKLRSLKLLG